MAYNFNKPNNTWSGFGPGVDSYAALLKKTAPIVRYTNQTMTWSRFDGQECEICHEVVKVGQVYQQGKHGEYSASVAKRDVAHTSCVSGPEADRFETADRGPGYTPVAAENRNN